uniref:Uncharacterized protein n=1 Tax=Lepeophtheirus salmonis TaxID=72036 RepID=A0A0K2SXR7_LEPSM
MNTGDPPVQETGILSNAAPSSICRLSRTIGPSRGENITFSTGTHSPNTWVNKIVETLVNRIFWGLNAH